MSITERLELFVECPRSWMDELLGFLRKLTRRPWMYWGTHYNASFSSSAPSFDFARFKIDDAGDFVQGPERSAKYLGQVRWTKHIDFNVLLAWATYIDGQEVSRDDNDFLIQDFYDLIVLPACEQLGLEARLGAGVWQKLTI